MRLKPGYSRSLAALCLALLVLVFGLAGCGAPSPQSQQERNMAAPVVNPPAPAPGQAQPVSTQPAPVQPQAQPTPTLSGDMAQWKSAQRKSGSLTFSYRYPPGWTADLAYCAPGAARTAGGNELPARCASTDMLVGQKAKDIGTLTGGNVTNLIINGKQAARQLDDNPRNGMASRIYTVIVYEATGAPLFGFSTWIGPGTDEATQNSITATLDKIAATLTVGR